MKKAFTSAVLEKIKERWGYTPSAILPDGTKYGSENDYQKIFNQILSITTQAELKAAEKAGAILYQDGAWRIPTLPSVTVTENPQPTVKVNPKYHEWMANRNYTLYRQQQPLVEYAKKLLVDPPF